MLNHHVGRQKRESLIREWKRLKVGTDNVPKRSMFRNLWIHVAGDYQSRTAHNAALCLQLPLRVLWPCRESMPTTPRIQPACCGRHRVHDTFLV